MNIFTKIQKIKRLILYPLRICCIIIVPIICIIMNWEDEDQRKQLVTFIKWSVKPL